jgi:ribosome-associated protein
MDICQLQHTIIDSLEQVKAQDIVVFNTCHLSDLFDRVMIASSTSCRHTKALAMRVHEAVETAGGTVIGIEGIDTGEWALVDCGDAIVHVLLPASRAYYRLEELWGDQPVQMTSDTPT